MKSEHINTNDLSQRRFGGIARLYGNTGLCRLQRAHVCIVGIGGVGSWVAESLARSAIGKITLIDMDLVSESNINRQILATEESIGRDKVLVMRDRIASINPSCEVVCIDDFISRDNMTELLPESADFIVDCIDDFRLKAALINHCKRRKQGVLCIGGAGGQVDASKIRLSDLSRTQHDVLLAKMRKLLRQDFGFPRNPKRSFGVPCVYSDEQLRYPDGEGGISKQRPAPSSSAQQSNALNCAGGMGSITHVTASFAFLASGHIINTLVVEPS